MLDFSKDTQPLATFQQQPSVIMEHLHMSKRAVTLTIDGQAAAVIQDPAEYQRLRDLAAQADVHEAIRQGLEDVDAGRVYPMEEAIELLRQKYDIPR
jgi:PHD/YefM family antitoxin component YafN of YafNO toxin-antitoxin module